MDNIGKRIQLLRGDMSQRALARRAGIEQATLSRIERGETDLISPNLIKISKALGIDFNELLDPSEDVIALKDRQPSDARRVKIGGMLHALEGDQSSIRTVPMDENVKYAYSLNEYGPKAFAQYVSDLAMLPYFSPGDLVIAEQHEAKTTPRDGQFVIALSIYPDSFQDTFLRRYCERVCEKTGKRLFDLVPTNPIFRTVTSEVEGGIYTICGIVRERITTLP